MPSCRCTFLYEHISNKRLLAATRTEGPRQGCMVCGKAQLHLSINTHTTTLATLVSKVFKKHLAVSDG